MHLGMQVALGLLAAALLEDWLLGEYPLPLHPVVWIGKTTSVLLRLAPQTGQWRQLTFGTILTLVVCGLSAGLAWLALWLTAPLLLVQFVLGLYLLKASFALRELRKAVFGVLRPLEKGDLAAAREALRSLCSRDPSGLDSEALLAATIQSLAENTCDSFVAPLFYYALLGVPGAMGYRAINTLDAMVGYRGRYEWLGKASARLDDLANWVPARLTAGLLLLGGLPAGANVRDGWRVLRRDGARTPSPNGGRPMAAMAGLLGIRLEKKGVYILGDAYSSLTPEKARQAWRLVACAAGLMVGLTAAGVVGLSLLW